MKTLLRATAVFALTLLSAAFPASAVTVEVDEAGLELGTVSWSHSVSDGYAVLSLTAVAKDGAAFSGWLVDGAEPDWGVDPRLPSLSDVKVDTNAVVAATFVPRAEDTLFFDVSLGLDDLVCGEPVQVPLDVYSLSYPTLTFSGLPAGLSFDPRTMTVGGTPTAPCVRTVVVQGRNASGYTFEQTFRTSVGDLSGERIDGIETEIPVGQYYHAEFEELFSCGAKRVSTALTGLPDGLVWNASWDLLSGTPKKSGVYVLKAVVRFDDGRSETATVRLTVAAPDPLDYGVDLSALDGLTVGDTLDEIEAEIGYADAEGGVVSVTGLPTGLSSVTWFADGVRHCGVRGTVRAPGVFLVRTVVDDTAGGAVEPVVTEYEVIVSDAPDRYLAVSLAADSSPGGGTVSGGGVLSVVSGAKVSARAASGFVFAGWFSQDGFPADVGEGQDFRNPELVYGADTEFEFMELFGRFVPKSDDASVEISDLAGEEFVVDGETDDWYSDEFYVASVSLPKLSAPALPAGVVVEPVQYGTYRLHYDGAAAAKRLKPGRYTVTLTAVNSAKASDSETFRLIVENQTDAAVGVEDDYGEFTPGEPIEPIDLSEAVDFANGETLSVSGLPRGLVYNARAVVSKGIDAHTVTGTPTVPGEYTLTFTAKVVGSVSTNAYGRVTTAYRTAVATAFLTVLPYPALEVFVDDDQLAAGNVVTGSGNFKPGSRVTLRAKPAKGWVFAGWSGFVVPDGLAALKPSLAVETDEIDQEVFANFVPVADDMLFVDDADEGDGFAAVMQTGVDVAVAGYDTLISDLIGTISLPSVKVSGLPSGVRFSASDLTLSGRPGKSGVYYATVTAKNTGGYSFVRILRIAVMAADGSMPVEAEPANGAAVDFGPLGRLTTGTALPAEGVTLAVGPHPSSGALPVKATVSGLPAGLKAAVRASEYGLAVVFTGTPTKVVRTGIEIKVTYADRTTEKSKTFVIVTDGGSAYLSVVSLDPSLGTVSGTGVYAAGATVKLSAKPKSKRVFTGWYVGELAESSVPFAALAERDGIDPRTATVSFRFRPDDTAGMTVFADFAESSADSSAEFALEGEVWEIDPELPSTFAFAVRSLSLPKLTTKGLPKGVSVDLARGRFVYTPTAAVKSGVYSVSLTAKNQSAAKASATFEIRVANRVSPAIGGLDPAMDAYALTVGVPLDAALVVPQIDEGYKLSVSGLPPGLSFKNGAVVGVPTRAGATTVTFTATKGTGASKVTEVATITLRTSALPTALTGTFNGFVYDADDQLVGTLTASATTGGKLSVAVKTAAGTERFSASSWTSLDDDLVAFGRLQLKNGNTCEFSVDGAADWSSWQLNGTYQRNGVNYRLTAQRNPFGTKDANAEAQSMAKNLTGSYSWDGLKLTVKNNGNVAISGRYEGIYLSGSACLLVDEEPIVQIVKIDSKNGVIVVNIRFPEGELEPVWDVVGK